MYDKFNKALIYIKRRSICRVRCKDDSLYIGIDKANIHRKNFIREMNKDISYAIIFNENGINVGDTFISNESSIPQIAKIIINKYKLDLEKNNKSELVYFIDDELDLIREELNKIKEKHKILKEENVALKEVIKLQPDSDYVLNDIRKHFEGLKEIC